MKRVMIIGGAGSGKSTLARKLGVLTGLPVEHIDQIHWKPGWVERADEEKAVLISRVHARDSWIFEGGNSRSYPDRIARADTCIWLDFPLHIRLWRVLKRIWRDYGKTRPDLPPGCPEQFDWEFITWIISTRHTGRIMQHAIIDNPPQHLTVHHLTNLKEVEKFLAGVKQR